MTIPYANREPIEKGPPSLFDYEIIELPSNVSLEIYFAPHQTAEDLPAATELEAIFKSSDIVVLEMENADINYDTKLLNRVSKGDYKALETVRLFAQRSSNPSWKARFYDSLYASKATVISADVPKHNPLAGRRNRSSKNQLSQATNPDFDLAVEHYASFWPEELEALRARDQYVLEHLYPAINTSITNNQKLADKWAIQPLRVVMFYGNDHYPIFEALEHKSNLVDAEGFSISAIRQVESVIGESYGRYLRDSSYPSSLDTAKQLVFDIYQDRLVRQPGFSDISGRKIVSEYFQNIAHLDYEQLRTLRANLLGF